MDFLQYTKTKGIKLLKDDIRFLRKMFRLFPKDKKKSMMLKYVEIWLANMNQEPIDHKKQNKGRYRANYWLLTYKAQD